MCHDSALFGFRRTESPCNPVRFTLEFSVTRWPRQWVVNHSAGVFPEDQERHRSEPASIASSTNRLKPLPIS
ncbi:MAG: hypothetical protein DRJ50_12940, partial [Actinobacteria bacterium]